MLSYRHDGEINMNRQEKLRKYVKAVVANCKIPYQTDFSYNAYDQEFAERVIDDNVEFAFMEGFQWAEEHPRQPWTSTCDKLPKAHETVLIHCTYDGQYYVGILKRDKTGEYWIIDKYREVIISLADTDYWKYIPELPKGGEK